MTVRTGMLRWFFLLALTIYVGGFTFYSVVVIPILHDRLESALLAGSVTQRVTNALNLLGVVTLSMGWCVYWVRAMHRLRGDPLSRWDFWPLLVSSIGLVVLLVLHRLLDRKLETGTLAGFYPYHRAYLWVSTLQWFANLALLTRSTGVFTPTPESRR